MQNSIFISLLILVFNSLSAQDLKVIEATKQNWAGGVCCSYGTNYTFSFESADTLQTISIDTLWIGKQYYVENQTRRFSFSKAIQNDKMIYHITVADSYNSRGIETYNEFEEIPVINPLKYKGQACIVYHVLNRRKIFEIENIIEYAAIAYP